MLPNSSQPVVIPTRGSSFRKGLPAPIEVAVDDGMSFKSGPRSVSVRDHRPRAEPRITSRRQLVRRPSSDYGGYSRARRSEARSPTRNTFEKAAPRRRSSSHHHRVEVVRETPSPSSHHHRVEVVREPPSPPRRSSRVPTKPPPSSFFNSFLPATTRTSRSRAATYEKPSSYEKITYEQPRHRDITPRYRTTRDPEPEDIRYKARSKSVHLSQQPVVVSRKTSRRSGSVDISDRMRLLAVRDRFRDEVDRLGSARPESQRYREYGRRSVR